MNKNNLYVDIHVLQNVPPSCINRDDTGSPKTAKYGGALRARVSSQAWKHEIRKMFEEEFESDKLGVRTRKVPQMIAEEIQKMDSSISSENADKLAAKILDNIGVKEGKKGDSSVLIFFSRIQAKALAELIMKDSKDKAEYKAALKNFPSVDMALFGRMVASDSSLNYDAAAQVAHAISTHAIHNEYDYFTAVDDVNKEDESGAGHLGTIEFNSSTLYRYANVNVLELEKNLGSYAPEALRGFVDAFIKSMPTGKQNTFANRTVPDFVYITIRKDQPINFAGAFEKPVSGSNGYLEESEKRFMEYAQKVYKNYACEPEVVLTFGEKNIEEILEELKCAIEEQLSESEVE